MVTVLALIGLIVLVGVVIGGLGEAFGPDGTEERPPRDKYYRVIKKDQT